MSGVPREESTDSIRAEAAAWLARLRSEERGPADEAGFRAWLTHDARHAQAFERVSEVWEATGSLGRHAGRDHRPLRAVNRRALVLGGAGALASIAGVSVWQLAGGESYRTRVGEQRRIALDDGSSVTLDTHTRIRVAFTRQQRQIELIEGRAYFEVATDPLRPFRVQAGVRQVIAVGTAFDVFRRDDEVTVALIEGRVAVQPVVDAPQSATRMLSAGERIVFEGSGRVVQDQPNLNEVTAWQTGRAVFDDRSLAEAVAEMNRYTRRPLVIADAALAAMHISGVYGTGDPEAFARSVCELLPARADLMQSQIVLHLAKRD
ncbi:MAG: Protein FecR [Steroidobacteraceae bacterium]|nr:Protein FecR [Steroidobacteraceae bacterium]